MGSRTRHLRDMTVANATRLDGDDKWNSAAERIHHHGRAGSNGGRQGRGVFSAGKGNMSPAQDVAWPFWYQGRGTAESLMPCGSAPCREPFELSMKGITRIKLSHSWTTKMSAHQRSRTACSLQDYRRDDLANPAVSSCPVTSDCSFT